MYAGSSAVWKYHDHWSGPQSILHLLNYSIKISVECWPHCQLPDTILFY